MLLLSILSILFLIVSCSFCCAICCSFCCSTSKPFFTEITVIKRLFCCSILPHSCSSERNFLTVLRLHCHRSANSSSDLANCPACNSTLMPLLKNVLLPKLARKHKSKKACIRVNRSEKYISSSRRSLLNLIKPVLIYISNI